MHPHRIAIVADWLIDVGGAELVLQHLLEMFPDADIYTSVCFMRHPMLEGHRIYTSWIQRIPFVNRRHKLAGILRPFAFRSFDLSGYDLIICSSSAESKQVACGKWRTRMTEGQSDRMTGGQDDRMTKGDSRKTLSPIPPRGTTRIVVYCHTPIRYYWSHYEEYRNMMEFGWLNPVAKWLLPKVIDSLRKLDYESAQKVDFFIANSRTTQERIRQHYHRESEVIYPGIEIPSIQTRRDDERSEIEGVGESISQEGISPSREYYISVGRCIPYKRFDLLVDAFNASGKRLILCTATDTPLFRELKGRSKANIEWRFRVSHEEKNGLIASARGFLFPPEEDFGIVPIEAMALGVPVIAYGKGGATESVLEGDTGLFFSPQTPEALNEAIEKFESMEWDRQKIHTHAKQFTKAVFQNHIATFLEKVWERK